MLTHTIQFSYNDHSYTILENSNDASTNGCIFEIVHRDEYKLSKFQDLKDQFLIDIGANCGVATLILAKQNPLSTVLSFEPDKTIFEVLRKNVELNQLHNVKLFNKAVSKKGIKELELILHPSFSGGNTTYSDKAAIQSYFATQTVTSYTVPCISLDEIVEEFSIGKIAVLKIDCEGAEFDILYNSESFKNKIVSNLIGEFHFLRYNVKVDGMDPQALFHFCSNLVEDIKITFLYI